MSGFGGLVPERADCIDGVHERMADGRQLPVEDGDDSWLCGVEDLEGNQL